MADIFDFTDYRKFLKCYYEERKASSPAFSYQFLASKAGFSNKGYVYNLIKGKRSLSKSNLFKMCEALDLNKQQTEYFEALVSFNQAEGFKEKNHYFEKLNQIRKKNIPRNDMQMVAEEQYEYYSTWYHSTIRSIIDMYQFSDDYTWLARMVNPQISVKQAKHSVELLSRLGMIRKEADGIYRVTGKNITTGKDIMKLAVQSFHLQCNDLARNAILNLPKEERNATGLTMGISQSTYSRLCDEIFHFQNRIAEIVNEDHDADRVYQLNFCMFPVSRSDTQRKKKE